MSIASLHNIATLFETERARLVRLCAYRIGSETDADDLAQETLIEAWRLRHRLVDPRGYRAWLSAIARNVCLRWKRDSARRSANLVLISDLGDGTDIADVPGNSDLEIELERDELANLLDKALGLLPRDTRASLIARYVEQLPQAEIAAQSGMSEGAVEARLQRGKLSLRKILTTQLRVEAAAYGFADDSAGLSQETRIWCTNCGKAHLAGRFDRPAGELAFSCPRCCPEPNGNSWIVLPNLLRGVMGFKAALKRQMAWADGYFRHALAERVVPCVACRRLASVYLTSTHSDSDVGNALGVQIRCDHCRTISWSSLVGLAINLAKVRQFWQAHQRIAVLPTRHLDYGGRAALLTRFINVRGYEALDVVSARDTLELLNIHHASNH